MQTKVYTNQISQFFEKGTTQETLFTGFASEVGEVMSERTTEVRKGEKRTVEIIDELSDTLWYLTMIARTRGYTLEEVMKHGVAKLEDRKVNGKR
jgi:NTP pyrophosphatase (non-canonical NTP hydrolase)